MSKPHPFDRITRGYHERAAARADVEYEAGRVAYLLGAVKLNVRKATSALLESYPGPDGALTFKAFNATYPSFPLILGASRLDGVKLHLEDSAQVPALFNRFASAPFVSAYEAFYEEYADRANGGAVGLVFPRKGVRQGLIMYTSDDPEAIPFGEREFYMVYVGGSRKKRHRLYVRSFQKTVEAVYRDGHGWTPADG